MSKVATAAPVDGGESEGLPAAAPADVDSRRAWALEVVERGRGADWEDDLLSHAGFGGGFDLTTLDHGLREIQPGPLHRQQHLVTVALVAAYRRFPREDYKTWAISR